MIAVNSEVEMYVDNFELMLRGWYIDSCICYFEQMEMHGYVRHRIRLMVSGMHNGDVALNADRTESRWVPSLVLRVVVREPYARTCFLRLSNVEYADSPRELKLTGEMVIGFSSTVIEDHAVAATITSYDGVSDYLWSAIGMTDTDLEIDEEDDTVVFGGSPSCNSASLLVSESGEETKYCFQAEGELDFVDQDDEIPIAFFEVKDSDGGVVASTKLHVDWVFSSVLGLSPRFLISEKIDDLSRESVFHSATLRWADREG